VESDNSRCPLCGDRNTEVYLPGSVGDARGEPQAFGSSRSSVAIGDVRRCGRCGFGFTESRLTEEELSKIYATLDERVYESEDYGRWITAGRHLRVVHRYKLPPGRLLDVGCASGRFLSIAAQNGWKVAGVEPSEPFYRRARLLLADRAELLQCTLQEASLKTAPFDVITMWDVLEHVPDPVGLLVLTRSLLKDGGRLFVNVPNLDSAIAKALGKHWPMLLPEHLNYFNRKSLRFCAERAGLRTITFGRRSVSISLDYLFFRLGQHRFPLSLAIRRLLRDSWFAKCTVPVFYGECFAVMTQA